MPPKVKKETINSTTFSLMGDKELLKKKLEQINKENHILFLILKNIAHRKDWSEKEKSCYILGAVQFYTFLSTQEECDELQKHNPI